jgi:hypothetical protein
MKTLAKSLHTVSVLVNVARTAPATFVATADRVTFALMVLGYENSPDPYGLAARAVAILEKDAQ